MHDLIKTVLEKRGFDEHLLQEINHSDNTLLKDIDTLGSKLHEIYLNKIPITVLSDFDMDGIMSGVIGYAGLNELGFDVELYHPTTSEGYGFSERTIDDLLAKHPRTQVILTCDVGISCFDGIDYALSKGLRVLVTDHHIQQNAEAMHAEVVVNPMRLDEVYPHPAICGAHVLWQCLHRYAAQYRSVYDLEQIERLLVFVGIGTVSDVMPVLYNNRTLLKRSLAFCTHIHNDLVNEEKIDGLNYRFYDQIGGLSIYGQAFRGLVALIRRFYQLGKIGSEGVTEDFYGFYLAPMFNSIKRMDGDISLAFGVFFSDVYADCIDALLDLNEERKLAVSDALLYIESIDQPYSPYIYISNANKGILGLVATKLMQENGGPTVVVKQIGNTYSGSGRSPEWYAFQQRMVEHGFYVAGHQGAFGIGFEDIRELTSCYITLRREVEDLFVDLGEIETTGDICLGVGQEYRCSVDLLQRLYHDIRSLRPFGQGFPKISFDIHFLKSACEIITMGGLKNHVKFILQGGFEVICWNSVHLLDKLGDKIVVRGFLERNVFNDVSKLNLIGEIVC